MPRNRKSVCNPHAGTAIRDLAAIDRLEPRMVLSGVDVAIVGMTLHQNNHGLGPFWQARSYALEGEVSDAGVLQYQMFWDGANGPQPGSPVRNAPLRFRDDGSFDYESWRWRGTLQEQGAAFLPQDGFAAGWWRARSTEWDTPFPIERVRNAEDQLIVPLAPSSTPLTAVGGTWTFSIHQRSATDRSDIIITGTLTIEPGSRGITWASDTSLPATRSNITSSTGGSRFTTSDGYQFYLAEDGSTLVFVDLKNSDGAVNIGVAVRGDSTLTMAEAAGTYSIVSNDGSEWSETSKLTLNTDGTYTTEGLLWRANPFDGGTWFIHTNGQIVIRPDSGEPEDRFILSTGGGSLLHVAGGRADTLFGFGTRAVTEGMRHDPVISVPSTGTGDEPLVFIDRTNAEWTVVNVVDASNGPETTGELVSWFDRTSGLARAAANTARGLTIYSENADGTWSYTVLGESLGTNTVLVGDLAHAPGPGGRMNLFGLTADGDLVRYIASGEGSVGWSEWNISELRLDPLGIATPDFAGNLVAYATPWGGLNVAGIDSGGDLQTVWTTTRATRWFVSNLSANTDAPPMMGDIAVAMGGIDGIFFSGANADGNLQVISWRPSDAGQWNLSVVPSSLVLDGRIASAFDRATHSFYVAFIPQGQAETFLYTIHSSYFSPHLPPPISIPLSPHPITNLVAPEDKIVSDLSVQIGPDGYVNVLGRNGAGETMRFKSLFTVGEWTHENLTEIAT